jgi:L-2-hydroxyglutarate oxidase LhgO
MSAANDFDNIIIGAGVVGLAIARTLARAGRTVLVLERHSTFGTEISSRHSEVIHAGIYYPNQSLKARLCVEGNELLYLYCGDRGIAHKRCGKLIVATTNAEIRTIRNLANQARSNGVQDLGWLNRTQIRELEPELNASEALLSSSSGIVDSHAFMLCLMGESESYGATFAFNCPVNSGRVTKQGFIVNAGAQSDFEISAQQVINCSGLSASSVARTIHGLPCICFPPIFLAKGNYFALTRRSPFSRLIYPIPVDGGLGVHLTLDLTGRARFGPDVEWVDEIEYSVSSDRRNAFYAAIRNFWPEIAEGDLQPAYSGIRPKLLGQGCGDSDFVIQGPADHGISGFVNLLGIESPGLTASLGIAKHVAQLCGVRSVEALCR